MTSVEGTADFIKAAHALNEAGDRELRKAVYKGFRTAAKPLGERMVDALAEDMPKRGGLSARVAQSKPSIRNATTGRNPRVEISLRGATGWTGKPTDLKTMNAGTVRHPVFARRAVLARDWAWTTQSVPADGATKAFEEGAPAVRAVIIRELNQVMTDTARKGSS